MLFKTESAHEESPTTVGSGPTPCRTQEFLGDSAGRVRALRLVDVEGPAAKFAPMPGTEREIPAELVTLAMGFLGPEHEGMLEQSRCDVRRARQRPSGTGRT